MAGNPVNIGSGFGKKFAQTGKFGKKGRKKIQQKFGSVQNFLNQSGVGQGNQLGTVGQTQQQLQSAFNQGQPQQPTQPTPPTPQPTQDPVQNQQGGVGSGLLQQATDLSNVGANILQQGNPATQPLLSGGQQFQQGAFQDLGRVNTLADQALAQGQRIEDLIGQQQQAAATDIQNFFSAQPLDTLRSNISALDAQNLASGRIGSRSGNEMQAELRRGLIRDQAQALLGSNQQFREALRGELGQQRSTQQGLAGLFSGQGLGQGGLGQSGLNLGGQLLNQTRGLGANIFNQGFQNQLGALGFINQAAQDQFQTQNQLLQQALANIQGAKSNRQAKNFRDQMLELQQEAAGGGGLLSGALGGLTGGLF